jgi:DNA-binding NtrC family response regulator
LVVVVTDQNDQGELFSETLRSRGFTVKCLSLADDVKEFLSENPARGVFIILSKVNEQGVSSIIKVKTACGTCTPLIAGGPEWTRNTVLQAVKYGACDIVVTPIIQDEIIEKVQVHLGESPAAEESKVD